MEPQTVYADKSPYGKRNYQLFADRIVVRHNDTLTTEGESVFNLRDLSPQPHTLSVRGPFLISGIWISVIAWLIYWIIVELAHQDSLGTLPGFFLALGFVGILMIILGLRKQRLVRFQTKAGVPAFDIFREGPQKKEFDTFLAKLQSAILTSGG